MGDEDEFGLVTEEDVLAARKPKQEELLDVNKLSQEFEEGDKGGNMSIRLPQPLVSV